MWTYLTLFNNKDYRWTNNIPITYVEAGTPLAFMCCSILAQLGTSTSRKCNVLRLWAFWGALSTSFPGHRLDACRRIRVDVCLWLWKFIHVGRLTSGLITGCLVRSASQHCTLLGFCSYFEVPRDFYFHPKLFSLCIMSMLGAKPGFGCWHSRECPGTDYHRK